MPINFNIDLSARRKQQQALDELEKRRKAVEAMTWQIFGTPTEGPPTATGLQSRIGGVLGGTPQASLAELQMTSDVPDMQQAGFQTAQQLMEQQRQKALADQQRKQLYTALQSPAIQATPEGQALANLILGGANPDQLKAFKDLLAPFTIGEARYSGATGTQVAIAPKKAAELDAERNTLFNQATKLRGEFTGITKPFEDQNQAYGRILASSQDPSPAGDLALIFNYMKVLDPGSTVREGEFANAENSGSIPSRIQAQYNKVISGERLAPEQRADFVDRAGRLFSQAAKQHKKTAEEFRQLAIRNKIDPKNVVFQRQTANVPPPPGFVENR